VSRKKLYNRTKKIEPSPRVCYFQTRILSDKFFSWIFQKAEVLNRQGMVKGRKQKRTKQTQAAILNAACHIFAKHAYNAASIRMIAKEGTVSHALIRYYYPTKADLFEAVAKQICENIYDACANAIDETSHMKRAEGFSVYIWRLIEFSKSHPWAFRIFLLNLSVEAVEAIPGQNRFVGVVEKIREKLSESLRLNASHDEICRFTDSFNALVMYYLGAPDSAAWLLHLNPDSKEYTQWVHHTLVEIFLPTLDRLFHSNS
jgi:AcrR family transcriptional regulator